MAPLKHSQWFYKMLIAVLVALLFTSTTAMTSDMLKKSMEHREELASKRIEEAARNTTQTISAACNASLIALSGINSTALLTRYADAAGKPGAGIMELNFAWLGSYDECLSIPDAHYCLAGIGISNPNQTSPPAAANPFGMMIKWGVCVPKPCTDEDLQTGLTDIIKAFGLESRFHLMPDLALMSFADNKTVHCAKPSEYTAGAIATLSLCGIILFLCFVGSVIDIALECMHPSDTYESGPTLSTTQMPVHETFGKHNNTTHNDTEGLLVVQAARQNKIVEFFLCFSLIRNTSRIMDTHVPPGAITSINGMRVLSMFWVILGHTFIWQMIGGNEANLLQGFTVVQRFTFQAIVNATVSVDSFFFLSGLLVAYLSFRHMEKKDGKLNLFQFYFHRFWRLTPAYMFVILFYDQLMGFLGSGPLWYTQQEAQPCDKYWWTNLLYINNFYPTAFEKSCLDWSWYLANDMQFYVISPIILFATAWFGKRGFFISVSILLISSFATTAAILDYYDMNSGIMGGGENTRGAATGPGDFGSYVYVKPYCRIAPYLVGMALGYLFHRIRIGNVRRLPMWSLLIGWCLAIILAIAPLYGTYSEYRQTDPQPFNRAENVFYGTFVRCSWALALAWVIFACHTGVGGLVNKILSARFWIPLSRLTYMAYLVHPIVLFAYFSSYKTVTFYSDVNVSWHFLAAVSVAYLCAFIVSVTIEFPMMQLEKILFKTDRKKD